MEKEVFFHSGEYKLHWGSFRMPAPQVEPEVLRARKHKAFTAGIWGDQQTCKIVNEEA
jgi:hypothetical protein